MQTIPSWSLAEGLSIDRVRELLRRRPDIAGLLQRVGATRIIPAERLDEFRDAVRQAIGGA